MSHLALRLKNIVRLRFRSIFSRRRVEQELDEELRYHLEREVNENLAVGMSSVEARSCALQAIRDLEQRKEECRDMLALIGLYGVIAYSVSQRTREVGIRIALGADRTAVYRLVLQEAAWLSLAGVVLGLVCSVAAAAFMRTLLFEVQPWDLSTLVAVACLLGTVALLASYLLARRAVSVNPVEALRAE